MIRPGVTIRDIRLVKRLGSGGMGEVFVGVQEALGREVAVKAIRADRRLDERAKTRFLREARILSRLEHPNICRLYDLIEVDGQDFIVLELIRGRSLRDLVGTPLTQAERLQIAEQVIAALVAAHAISVVHRDIKPENIMVEDDGTVKVLDFGLARRALRTEDSVGPAPASPPADGQGSATAPPSDWTQLGDVLGTPRYMSPEQARGDALTAASDMYAFGLLLQELWTGQAPYGEGLGANELVQRAMWGEITPAEGIDPQVAGLIGDLTAFEPGRRLSATAAADRLRWIRERPGRRARKRAVIAVIAALALAAGASIAGFFVARQSQRRAEAAQAEAEAVNDFLRGMLASAAPERQGIDTKVVDVLDNAAERIDVDFADHPLSGAAVHQTLGETYLSLGVWSSAHRHFEAAAAIRRTELGAAHSSTLIAKRQIGIALSKQGRWAEAEAALRENLDQWRRVGGHDDEIHAATANLAVALQRLGRFEEAEPMVRQDLAWKRRTLGEEDDRTLNARLSLANLLARSGRGDEAIAELREVLLIRGRAFGEDHPDTLAVASNLAVALSRSAGGADEAAELFEDTAQRRHRVLGAEHPGTLLTLEMQAVLLRRQGRFDDAETLCREVLEVRGRTLGDEHPDTVGSVMALAVVLAKQGRAGEAERMLRSALATAERTVGPDHPTTFNILGNLGNTLMAQGKIEEAEEVFRELLSASERLFGPDHPRTQQARNALAALLRETGRPDEADALESSAQ